MCTNHDLSTIYTTIYTIYTMYLYYFLAGPIRHGRILIIRETQSGFFRRHSLSFNDMNILLRAALALN